MKFFLAGIFLSLFSVITLFNGVSSAEASCIQQSVSEYKEQADIIVLGNVTEMQGKTATVAVEQYFKGHGGPKTILLEGDDEITSIDFMPEEGKRYLLYLKIDGDEYETNLCMGSREVTDGLTGEESEVLGAVQNPIPLPAPDEDAMAKGFLIRNINLFLISVIALGAAVLWVYFYRYPRKKKKK